LLTAGAGRLAEQSSFRGDALMIGVKLRSGGHLPFVSGCDEETARLLPGSFVDRRGNLDPLQALFPRALTDQLEAPVLEVEGVADLANALIDFAE
jgi:hypothetical protein